MKNSIISQFNKKMLSASNKEHPRFRAGDTIRVNYKIEEGAKVEGEKKEKKKSVEPTEKKFRIQTFEGVCSRFRKGETESTFTIRKIGANSIGVERTFPFFSPMIDSIEVVSGGKVRRARLYYLRSLSGKAARIKARRLPAGTTMKTVTK